MALTRETRSLSISNMPYVRPTNPIGDFARTVQRDAAQELKELYAEEDRITVAESVASVYDRAKEIQVSQEGVPNSAAMADELGKYTRKMLKGVNPSVQAELKAQLPGIISPIVNKTVDLEVAYNIDQNVQAIQMEVEELRRRAIDNVGENFDSEQFQNEHYAKLTALQERLKTVSQGTIPQEVINKQFSAQRIDFATEITARQYARVAATMGRAEAEKLLTKRAEEFANQFTSKRNFEGIVRGVLEQTDLDAKIKKSHAKYVLDFEKLSFNEQKQRLAEAEAFLHPALYEKLAEKHSDEMQIEATSDKQQGLESLIIEKRRGWLSFEDINEFFDTHQQSWKGADRRIFNSLRTRELGRFYTLETAAKKGAIDAEEIRNQVKQMSELEAAATNGEIAVAPTHFSHGTALSKSQLKKIEERILGYKNGKIEHDNVTSGKKQPENKDILWWENYTARKVNAAIEEGVFKDPIQTAAFFKENVSEWSRYKKLPKAIEGLFDIRKDAATLKSLAKLKQDIEVYNLDSANIGAEIVLPQDMQVNALFEIIDPAMSVQEINDIKQTIFNPLFKGDPNEAISEAQKLVTTVDEDGVNLVQKVMHEMGADGIIAAFGAGLFNSWVGHSRTGSYDFFAGMNDKLHLITKGMGKLGFWNALTAGLDSQMITMSESARRKIHRELSKEFLKFDKGQITNEGAIRTVLNKLGSENGSLGFSSNMYQKDQNSMYVHNLPPEQVLKDPRGNQLSGKQIAISMIEKADQILRNMDEEATGKTHSEQWFPPTSQYRRGRDNAVDGKGEIDLGLLYKAGRLKLMNGQQFRGPDGQMQTTYEMVIIDQRNNTQKLFIPGRGPRINFSNSFDVRQTSASRAIMEKGHGFGSEAIGTGWLDIGGGGLAGKSAGKRLDAIAKNRPIKQGFGLTKNPDDSVDPAMDTQ